MVINNPGTSIGNICTSNIIQINVVNSPQVVNKIAKRTLMSYTIETLTSKNIGLGNPKNLISVSPVNNNRSNLTTLNMFSKKTIPCNLVKSQRNFTTQTLRTRQHRWSNTTTKSPINLMSINLRQNCKCVSSILLRLGNKILGTLHHGTKFSLISSSSRSNLFR